MDKVAVFNNSFGGVSVVSDVSDNLRHVPFELIAKISVPDGVKFWIIEKSDLPGYEFRDAWEIDEETMGPASGIGGDRYDFDSYLSEGDPYEVSE